MDAIEFQHITKDYGEGKGLFDVSFHVKRGEVYGFLGPNGAGKTTAIRHLMGFLRPDSGNCRIQGMDCFLDAAKIQNTLGYLAGEIAFMDDMTGRKLLDFIADMRGMKDRSRMEELIEMFELNPNGKMRKMSKGMKQKVGIILACMHSPEILLLDEPTSGLDPLMQNRFVELILQEKKKGTTVFMSSHMFEEIEKTCDRTAIIRNGKIAAVEQIGALQNKRSRQYLFTLPDAKTAANIRLDGFEIKERSKNTISVRVTDSIPKLLRQMAEYPVTDMEVKSQTLEEFFLHFYQKEQTNQQEKNCGGETK